MPRAPYAADPAASRGREFASRATGARGPRTAFQRDRDRIIHSIAFRRLAGKTQVFVAPDGDHYRVRLTHSLEVAQIGRVIARDLRLDEDLTEALCLAHDLGHPPFGHSGEDALEAALAAHGGFDHNGQTLRTCDAARQPLLRNAGPQPELGSARRAGQAQWPGGAPKWALAELDAAYPLDLARWPTLEAQVAALADDIAYDNHDIDDGLRAGFLDLDDLLTLDFLADLWRECRSAAFPVPPREQLLRELVRSQIGVMVNDLLETTRANLAGVESVEEVRGAGRALAAFSPEMAARERRLKRFMYERLYHHADQLRTAERAQQVIAQLYSAYDDDPSLMTPGLGRTPAAGRTCAVPPHRRFHRRDDRQLRHPSV